MNRQSGNSFKCPSKINNIFLETIIRSGVVRCGRACESNTSNSYVISAETYGRICMSTSYIVVQYHKLPTNRSCRIDNVDSSGWIDSHSCSGCIGNRSSNSNISIIPYVKETGSIIISRQCIAGSWITRSVCRIDL